MRTSGRTLVVAATLLAATALAAAPPAAATDTANGLTLDVSRVPHFTVGSQGGLVKDSCQDYSTAQATLTYKATSPSGISGYDIAEIHGEGVYPPTHHSSHVPLVWTADTYTWPCGGESLALIGWKIVAHDNAGHKAIKRRFYGMYVIPWNRSRGVDAFWKFGPGWSASTCTCADGGSQNYTTTAGAAGTYVAQVDKTGTHLGLMMATGPTRGKASITLDGVRVAIVDTHATANRNRVYVWDSGALSVGKHTVMVTDLATAGHPRIDVNAMTTLR
jgi:hypothetical protein